MIISIPLTCTDEEAFNYVNTQFSDDIRSVLRSSVGEIINESKNNRITAIQALSNCLETSYPAGRIFLLAAYYSIKIRKTMSHRKISHVRNDLFHYKNQLAKAVNDPIALKALSNRIFQLELELEDLNKGEKAKLDPNNITIRATIVKANSAEFPL